MSLHWKVLAWMLAGVVFGLGLQRFVDGAPRSGLSLEATESGLVVMSATGPGAKSFASGEEFGAVIVARGSEEERRELLSSPSDFHALVSELSVGEVLWIEAGDELRPVTLDLDPSSARARWLAPFDMLATIFLSLLKMLIVPLVLSSIVCGVAGVGTMKDLRRLGGKTFLYYISTSLLAICVGQGLVNLIRPGIGADLGLSPAMAAGTREENFIEIFVRMVPSNIFEALTDNGAMLKIIFFALLLGVFITKAGAPHSERMREFFESFFAVMMKMAEGVLALLPYGVFALLVKVVARTGFAVFEPLLLYMGTVAAALLIHACFTLPALLRIVGGISPRRWFKAMSPALMTAFSTSSSSMTLPVTLRSVEERGKVSSKVTSFTLPLGATINMDGTALYECIGVIFLAQYYGSLPGGEMLTFTQQGFIVVMALMASIGAAGIPSAGLVMMLTILSALGLPLEGAALLLAVDRPLDMMRTVVNVWSDSCGAAIIARSEGETAVLDAGSSA
ncbi:MAG: dicarboxylate/amino acid:cation symporter [Planctomycetota bacterium]|nr:dicarboxylate/amino acid:cation symporter [Planctomycetota bacterium]